MIALLALLTALAGYRAEPPPPKTPPAATLRPTQDAPWCAAAVSPVEVAFTLAHSYLTKGNGQLAISDRRGLVRFW